MLDLKQIREDAATVGGRLAARDPSLRAVLDRILAVDAACREAETRLQTLNAERKRLSKEVGAIRSRGGDSEEVETRVRGIGAEITETTERVGELGAERGGLLASVPNLPHPDCPPGSTAEDNPVIRAWGDKPDLPADTPDHLVIGRDLGLFDIEAAATISGSGFAVFTGAGARLERALIQFMLDLHTGRHGYTEVSPPFLVRRDCMTGTGQLPKFEDDMYGLDGGSLFLAPTAEVPVTNLERERILREEDLPIRHVAYTPCFRREAGAAGRESRGLIRLHQFDKVELVRITRPADSYGALEALTGEAEAVLRALGLHYRVIELCAGDLGFSAAKTYDIEVWSPGQNAYLEVSSCSNFEDFQARRMNLRYKDAESGRNVFCHTLNGSGTALPRLFVALIESGVQPDGSVVLPEPLHRYFGADRIGRF